jgi:prepilin peptidase CpaA
MHDLLTKRIPNWLTLPAIVLGIAAQIWFAGMLGGLNGVLGMMLGFGVFFPVHFLGYMGAGDVKLLMAVGAWVGWQACVYVAIVSVVIGGAYALVEIIFRGRASAVAISTYSFLRALFVPGLVAEKLRLDENRKFAFGICIAGGVAGMIYLRHAGMIL